MKLLVAIAAAIAVLASPTAARAQPVTADEARALQSAVDRGLDLYRYDQAAWHATDAMLRDLPDPHAAGVEGWIVTPFDDGWKVVFWKRSGDGFEGAYAANYAGGKVSQAQMLVGADAILEADQVKLIRAREAIDARELERCSKQPFNSVVLPSGKPNGSVYVYYLTPQETLTAVPLGGHYRFEVVDGQVVDRRGFTKSCVAFSLDGGEAGSKPKAMVVSHLLDPMPTEVHIFWMLSARLPLYVVTTTNKRTWVVESSGGQPRIRLVKAE